MNKFYTTDEVAKMFNVCRMTIIRYVRAGKLKGFLIGRSWRFTEDQIEDYIRNHKK